MIYLSPFAVRQRGQAGTRARERARVGWSAHEDGASRCPCDDHARGALACPIVAPPVGGANQTGEGRGDPSC